MKTRLLTKEPITPKLQAASAALDARIAAGEPTVQSESREDWAAFLAKLNQTAGRDASRACLESLLARDKERWYEGIGAEVKAKLVMFGVIKETANG